MPKVRRGNSQRTARLYAQLGERLVRKEDSNFERKSPIMRFLSRDAKLRTRTCTRTNTASNP